MSKIDKRIEADQRKAAEESRSNAMIEANHGEKIAHARQLQADKIAADEQARAAYRSEHDAEMPGEPATRFNTPAIYEERLWRVINCSRAGLARALNQLEQEGWKLVNLTSSGTDAYSVVGARTMQYALPEEPEVDPASEETTSENAPDVVTDDLVESLRKEWALNQDAPEARSEGEAS